MSSDGGDSQGRKKATVVRTEIFQLQLQPFLHREREGGERVGEKERERERGRDGERLCVVIHECQ